MKTTLINRQQKHPIATKKLQKLTDWLSVKLESSTPHSWEEVCIILLDDAAITKLNVEYFDKNKPTDVITFTYDPIPGEPVAYSGDLLINVERAILEGVARNDCHRELALYIAHGFDHLTGANDDTPERRKKMRTTENAWLDEANAIGLINGLLKDA